MSTDREVVICTGAGGGIGRQIVHQLTESGLDVLAVDMSDEAIELARMEAHKNGTFRCAVADVSSFPAAAAIAGAVGDRRLRGLVNCAGTFKEQPFEELSEADWAPTIMSNLITTISMCRAVMPILRGQRYGSVVNFASTAGEYGSIRPAAVYSAAKGGVIGFSKSLAREYGPEGVRVNVVSPGPTDTSGFKQTADHDARAAAARTLLGRMGTPADIANGVSFLLSDASAWITGDVMRINGGSLI